MTPEELAASGRMGGVQNGGTQVPVYPTDPMGYKERDRLRRVAQGDGPAQPDSLFTEQEKKRAQVFLSQLLRAFQNINFTASQPAHDVPGFWSDPVDIFGQVNFPAATITDWTDVATFVTRPGRWARIEQYGQDVSDLLSGDAFPYDGTLQFRMLMGGQTVPGLNTYTEQRGSAARPRDTFFLSNGDNDTATIKFQCRRAIASPDPLTVTLNFRGWTWRALNNYEGPKASQMQ